MIIILLLETLIGEIIGSYQIQKWVKINKTKIFDVKK